MTITTTEPATSGFDAVTFDLYRDVHKAIRIELFTITTDVGRIDPSDRVLRVALADRIAWLAGWLEGHAHHEDTVIEPELRRWAPDLAATLAADHQSFDVQAAGLVDRARDLTATGAVECRHLVHDLYLSLASFTSAYLAHQDLEERVAMPTLEAALGVPRVVEMHRAILGSIPPEEMAEALSLMLPAINAEDRVEMLGGMQMDAPPEVFAGVWALAGSVLAADDYEALGRQLGLA